MLMCSTFRGNSNCRPRGNDARSANRSTPVDGMVQLIEDGVNGYLSDDDCTLSDRVVSILTDDSLRGRLAGTVRKRIRAIVNEQKFYMADLESIYSEASMSTVGRRGTA